MKLDVVFCGVGGQGVVVLSDVFCEAALIEGFDVAKAEIHGMAQRGGSIVAHARVGDKVQAPLIERGKADVVLGFEVLETARALPMLKNDGTVVVNTKYIPPSASTASSTNLGICFSSSDFSFSNLSFLIRNFSELSIVKSAIPFLYSSNICSLSFKSLNFSPKSNGFTWRFTILASSDVISSVL